GNISSLHRRVRDSRWVRLNSACAAPHQAGTDAARRRGTGDHYGRRHGDHFDGTDESNGAGSVRHLRPLYLFCVWKMEDETHWGKLSRVYFAAWQRNIYSRGAVFADDAEPSEHSSLDSA